MEDFDKELDQAVQIFVSLFSGSTAEPLDVVQIAGKGIAKEGFSEPYGHFVGMWYFQTRTLPQNSSLKKC